jgi:hypothetical protein
MAFESFSHTDSRRSCYSHFLADRAAFGISSIRKLYPHIFFKPSLLSVTVREDIQVQMAATVVKSAGSTLACLQSRPHKHYVHTLTHNLADAKT